MIFEWESEEERLLRFMRISPKKKLEWLRQMNEFSAKYTPAKYKKIRQQLRQMRSLA